MRNRLKTQQGRYSLPATVPGPRPGDFALGSLQSRAAARAIVAGYAEAQRKEEEIELANLTPVEQAMSEGTTGEFRLWMVRLARTAEERAKAFGFELPTPEWLRHRRQVFELADELCGGELSQIALSNPAEEKRLRDLAEEKLRSEASNQPIEEAHRSTYCRRESVRRDEPAKPRSTVRERKSV